MPLKALAARTAAVLAVAAATALASGPTASADTGAASASQIGDIELLNNLNVCPGITTGIGLGNVLGILGIGTADPDTTGGPITCTIDDRDTEPAPQPARPSAN